MTATMEPKKKAKTFLAMAMFPWWWWVSVEMARVWWRSRHA